ncbi:hypothetical protein HHK36_011531 [Tetracentron sinense]|uniref:Uncharacterized protein n=1 Tax=Tetracentron sinense TaxID=13715 RepID=A0A835DJY9_TETSI|nr:hypothetical protein HHK36_011531 [Tetracentron sinense]
MKLLATPPPMKSGQPWVTPMLKAPKLEITNLNIKFRCARRGPLLSPTTFAVSKLFLIALLRLVAQFLGLGPDFESFIFTSVDRIYAFVIRKIDLDWFFRFSRCYISRLWSILLYDPLLGGYRDSRNMGRQNRYSNNRNGEGEGNGVDYKYYLPLSIAARKGDWRSARSFFQRDPDAVMAVINIDSQTAIHVATAEGKSQFVKKLLEFMSTEALELRDSSGSTVLHYAAISGNIDLVKSIVRRNPNLPQISNNYGWTPLFYAAVVATLQQKEMLWHLCSVTRDQDPSPFVGALGAELICNITALVNISLQVVKRYPHLATAFCGNEDTLLLVMAQRPSAFRSGNVTVDMQLIDALRHTIRVNTEDPLEGSGDLARSSKGWVDYFRKFMNIEVCKLPKIEAMFFLYEIAFSLTWFSFPAGIKQVSEIKLSHMNAIKLVKHVCTQIQSSEFFRTSKIFTTAIEFGVIELVVECLESFRRLNVSESELIKETSMFHIAVEHRRENIFKLVYGRTVAKMLVGSIKDEFGNTILHLAAKLAPSPQLNSISGAALQMQRELQWFKVMDPTV